MDPSVDVAPNSELVAAGCPKREAWVVAMGVEEPNADGGGVGGVAMLIMGMLMEGVCR